MYYTCMDTHDMRVRLANLLKDETLEQTMIALYDALLRMGVEKCVADPLRDEFVSGIETLKRDSEFHRVAVKKMAEKYQADGKDE